MATNCKNGNGSLPMHEFATLFPAMTNDEYAALKQDIAENGVDQPVYLWQGQIIDGRHRYLACGEMGIDPPIRYLNDDDDPVRFVLSANMDRRQLDEGQRAMVMATLKVMPWGANRFSVDSYQKNSTLKARAARAQVAESTQWYADEVLAFGDTEIIDRVRQGKVDGQKKLGISEAYKAIQNIKKAQKAEQKAAVLAEAERKAAQQARAEQGAAQRAAAEQAEQEAAKLEAAERAQQQAAEKARAEREAAEQAQREAAEKARAEREAAEEAAEEARQAAEKARAEREAAEQAAEEARRAAECAEQAAAEQAAAEQAAAEQVREEAEIFETAKERYAANPKLSIAEAIEEVKRERRRAKWEEKQTEKRNAPPTDGIRLFESPCAELHRHVEAETVDIILTDPPYQPATLSCYKDLAELAAYALKPSGVLLAMCGTSHLPQVLAYLCNTPGLTYHWTLNYMMPGGNFRFDTRGVRMGWKPVIWLVKGESDGTDRFDVVTAPALMSQDTRYHEWGQNEGGFKLLLDLFAFPGQVVCDPFLGGGTTAVVARDMGCSFIGADIDASYLAITDERLGRR